MRHFAVLRRFGGMPPGWAERVPWTPAASRARAGCGALRVVERRPVGAAQGRLWRLVGLLVDAEKAAFE